MNEAAENFTVLERLVLLAPEDPERQAFEAALPEKSAAVRARWHLLVREEELLRDAMARGAVPPDLVETLLALPGTAPKRHWREARIPWPIAAAIVLAALGTGAYSYWVMDRTHSVIVSLPPAPKEAVSKATELAVGYHDSAPALEIQSGDAMAVTAALQKEGDAKLLFAVALPAAPADFHLLGGSLVPFGSAMAVYTRWETGGKIYSLYQFAPQSVGMPRAFDVVTQTQIVSASKQPLRVMLWPGQGQGCTWASVSDPAVTTDPFCGQTY